jgi:plastocyanin
MTRKLVVLMVVVLGSTALALAALAAPGSRTVTTRGDEVLKVNVGVNSTLRFSPGPLNAGVGDSITWVAGDKIGAPHTVTLTRNPEALVETFLEMIGIEPCPACDAAIGGALGGHFPDMLPPVLELGLGDGFGADGDSFLFGNGFPASKTVVLEDVTAGETVYYFCAIHPWMQGSIDITG